MRPIAAVASILATLGLVTCLAPGTARALSPAHLWGRPFGSVGAEAGQAVAVDPSGNVYITGYFTNTINLGGSNLTSAGGNDIFVASYTAAGIHRWSQRFGSTGDDRGAGISVQSPYVVVTGQFAGTVSFGGSSLVSAGSTDAFLACYINNSGVHYWSRAFGSTSADIGCDVALSPSLQVVLVGYFAGTVNFGGSPLVSAGSSDIVVAQYEYADGAHVWSNRYGSTGSDQGLTIDVDASSNILVSGSFSGTVGFGGASLPSAGLADIFLAKYNSSGAHQWSLRAGGTSNDYGYGVETDASGNVYACGIFRLSSDFGGGALVSAGIADIYLAKYNSSGVHQWSKRFGGANFDIANNVAVDPTGSIALTGYITGAVDLGTGPVGGGGSDAFISRYDQDANPMFSAAYGSNLTDSGVAVAFDPTGGVFMTGYFAGSASFGGPKYAHAGADDGFLARYSVLPSEPVISAIEDIPNDQGRRVKITFARSGHDQAEAEEPIERYEAYRRDAAGPVAAPLGNSTTLPAREPLDLGWTEVGWIHAHGTSGYGIDVSTIGDSTAALGQYQSQFFIRAATGSMVTFHDSPADSGYSLDNLAPGIPQNFVYAAGQLSWDESSVADFDFFTVYGSGTDAFGSATVVDYSVAPAMDVISSPYVYYFVTATDYSGNEGKPAMINAPSGADGMPASFVLSVSNYPNPFNPSTTVSYTVPSRGKVSVAICDARGARIATLVDNEDRAAGAYRAVWDGRDERGVVAASGVYFARIEHTSGTRSKRMVLLK